MRSKIKVQLLNLVCTFNIQTKKVYSFSLSLNYNKIKLKIYLHDSVR